MLDRLSSFISLIVMYSLVFSLGEPVLRVANAQERTITTSPAGTRDLPAPAQAQALTASMRVFLPLIMAQSTSVAIISGNNQTATVGTAVVAAPTVRVVDSQGQPVVGARIDFVVTSGGGEVAGGQQQTDVAGLASVASWTLGTLAGANTIDVVFAGQRVLTFTAAGTAGPATMIEKVSGNGGTTTGGSTRVLKARVVDAHGNTVAGHTVAWAVTSGGGLVSAASSTTDAHGIAAITWTLGATPGLHSVAATATGVQNSPLTFNISVAAGEASLTTSTITATPTSLTADGTSTTTILVQLKDASGNNLLTTAGLVTLTTTTGTLSAVTDHQDGTYTATLTAPTTRADTTITAALDGSSLTQTASVRFTAGSAATLTKVSGDGGSAAVGSQRVLHAKVVDAFGNVVEGHTVQWAVAAGGGTLSAAGSTTNADGIAAVDWVLGTSAGTQSVTAGATGVTGSSQTFTVTAEAGSPTQLAITTQPSATAQSGTVFTQQPVLQLRDAHSNPVAQSGVVVTAAIASGGGILGGTKTINTDANGVATFTNLLLTGTIGDRTLAFAATGLSSGTSATIALTSGTPTQLVITTQPSATARAGVAFTQQPVIQVQDASGNLVTQADLTITAAIASGGGTLDGTVTATTDASGSATFTHLSIGGATGNRTLAFSASAITGATSTAINVTAGNAATLGFTTQPSTVIANAPITPAVQVSILDAYGNLVTSATNNVTITIGTNPGGSTLSGTTTVAASDGVASFANLSLSNGGTGYTLTASSGPLSGAISAAFNVIVGPLDHFLVEQGGGGTIENQLLNTSFPVRVTAQDAYNNTVPTFTGTVNFTSTPAGGVSAGNTSVAFTAGVLSSHSITFGTPGTFTLTATGSFKSGTSTTFEVQAPPTAVNEGPMTDSSPGQHHHAFFSTIASPQTFNLAAPGVLSNDNLGFPAATITSFGADSLGGSVTTFAAGSTVAPLPGGYASGSLRVASNGAITFTPPDDFTGNYVFRYRLTNALGISDARVTIAVGARPVAVNDTYTPVLVGNVPINTATSTQFRVATNDAGDAKTLTIVSQSNGTAALDSDSAFTFRPTPGFEGTASFSYTVSNGFGTSAPATVSLTVANPIWFVQAGAAAGGNGRYDAPFTSLSTLASINNGTGSNPAANDRIFLYSGSYAGPLTLLAGQRVIGQGATASLSSIAGVTWPADAGSEPAMNGTAPTLTSSNGTALNLANIGSATTANNTLRGFTIGSVGTTGTALSGTSFGALTISEVGINTNGQALNLTTGRLSGSFTQVGSTGGTNNIALTNVTTPSTSALGANSDALSGATGDALVINGGNGSFTYAGSITNSSSLAVNITNKTGGSITLAGDINPSAAGRGIAVTNNATGDNTITFSGAVQKISSGTFAGVNLANNPGAGIAFTGGGLAITTTTGSGFNATGGGTVIVDGTTDTSTISSTGGVALNVANTMIGTGGLNFRSISANGGSNGIVLNNTGASGGLTVSGFGAAGTGGTIQNTSISGVSLTSTRNVSLSWMNVTNASSVDGGEAGMCDGSTNSQCNGAMKLNNVTSITLDRLALNGSAEQGINGINVTKLTLSNSTISGSGNGVNESGIYLFGLFGTTAAGTANAITNTIVTGSGSANHNVFIRNNTATNAASGMPDRLVISSSSFVNPGSLAAPSDGITVSLRNTANFQTVVENSTFTQATLTHGTDGIQVDAGDTSTSDVFITGSTFAGTAGWNQAPINISGSGGHRTTFIISGNPTIKGGVGNGINVIANGGGTMRGTIANNTNITTGHANNNGIGISVEASGASTGLSDGTAIVDVNGNTVTGYAIGLRGTTRGEQRSSAGDLTIRNNTITAGGNFPLYGVYLTAGNGDNQASTRICSNLSNNQVTASGGIADYALEQWNRGTFQLQGYTGGAANHLAVQSFVSSRDVGGAIVDAWVGTTVNYTQATCVTP